MVVRFSLGKRMKVTDRADYKEFLEDNAHDPAIEFEAWAGNSVPEALVVLDDRKDDDEEYPYYKVRNEHINNNETTSYMYHNILQGMLDAGILEEDGFE